MATSVVIHLAAALLALAAGTAVIVARKGTPAHKALGRAWVALMLAAALSSLWVPAFLQFSWIHLLTALTLFGLARAVWAIRHGDVRAHRRAMVATYLGLVGAFIGALAPGRLVGGALARSIGF
jgi:uncharacterized membrane protein